MPATPGPRPRSTPAGDARTRPPHHRPATDRPRDLPTALAGTGVAVAVLGLLNWSSNVVTTGSGGSGGDPSSGARLGGFLIAAVLTVLGYLFAVRARRGVLVTAGVGASALGIPISLAWLSFGDHGGGHLPIQLDAVALGRSRSG